MTMYTMKPTMVYEMRIDNGPALARELPVPMIRPVPIAPPMAIIVI